METLLEILRELHPETDFASETALVDHGIEEEFDVVIPAKDIVPEHFNSAKALYALIEQLQEQDD